MKQVYIRDLSMSEYFYSLGFNKKQTLKDVNDYKNKFVKKILKDLDNPFKYYIFKRHAKLYGYDAGKFKKLIARNLNSNNAYDKLSKVIKYDIVVDKFDKLHAIYKTNLHYKTKRKILYVLSEVYSVKHIYEMISEDVSYSKFKDIIRSEGELCENSINIIHNSYNSIDKNMINNTMKLIDILKL